MKILITGATGLVGQNLVELLVNPNYALDFVMKTQNAIKIIPKIAIS